MSQTPQTTALPPAESAALETLYEAFLRAQQALVATQLRFAPGGRVQRLGPGAWIVTSAPSEEAGDA